MALLTEKQMLDLADTIVDGSGTTFHCIKKWNEKQSAAIEPNWKRIPIKVKTCHIRQYYFDSEGNEIDWDYIFSYERPATPHPHAEIMAKYAEVAARRIDPWVEFELSYCDEDWIALETPTFFDTHLEYRYIGDTK